MLYCNTITMFVYMNISNKVLPWVKKKYTLSLEHIILTNSLIEIDDVNHAILK